MEVIDVDLDGAGLKFRIHHAFGPGPHFAADGDHIVSAQGLGVLVGQFVDLGIEHHLGEPFLVPQVDEDQSTVVPAGVHPSAHGDGFIDIFIGQLAAVMGSFKFVGHGFL